MPLPVTDKFKNQVTLLGDPAEGAFNVFGDNVAVYAQPTRSLYIGATGNVTVRFADTAQIITFANVPAGSILPIRVDMVYANTTANSMVGMY